MSPLNNLMGRGIVPPVVHGVLDYPLAAALIVLPFVLGFDDAAATWIAFAFGIGAAVLAVGTAWSTGIVHLIPPLLHGYADVAVTVALIVLPFVVGFGTTRPRSSSTSSWVRADCSRRSRRASNRACLPRET
jgi:hypothetical protein